MPKYVGPTFISFILVPRYLFINLVPRYLSIILLPRYLSINLVPRYLSINLVPRYLCSIPLGPNVDGKHFIAYLGSNLGVTPMTDL